MIIKFLEEYNIKIKPKVLFSDSRYVSYIDLHEKFRQNLKYYVFKFRDQEFIINKGVYQYY